MAAVSLRAQHDRAVVRVQRERELLELLQFKLEEERLLLTAGKSRWLPFATREVEQVLDRLRASGLERTIAASDVAEEWDAPEHTLGSLIAAAPTSAWRETFEAHQRALTDLTAQIAEVRDANLQYLRAATQSPGLTFHTIDVGPRTRPARLGDRLTQ